MVNLLLKTFFCGVATMTAMIVMAGCCCGTSTDQRQNITVASIPDNSNDIMNFDATAWKNAPSYPFLPATAKGSAVAEGGTVKFLHDKNRLIVLADMTDSDLVQENDKDNQHHYLSGDLLEVFVRPYGKKCYWELYGTPNNRRSVFFYPSFARRINTCLQDKLMDGLIIKTELKGTLNNYTDKDNGWRCLMIIPLKELEKECGKIDFSQPLEVQVARYNYSVYLADQEFCQIGKSNSDYPNYHNFSSWVKLYLKP